MKKSITLVLLAILIVTFLAAATQKAKEFILPIMGGKADDVKRLIDSGVDVNEKFDWGATQDITALVFAVMLGQTEICRILIDAGADVNMKSSGGTTLLHHVAFSGGDYKDTAELLIAKGLDVNAKITRSGEIKDGTPLHLAAPKGNVLVAELLIQNGADVNAKSMYGETPLDLGISKEHNEIVDLLRKHGGISGIK